MLFYIITIIVILGFTYIKFFSKKESKQQHPKERRATSVKKEQKKPREIRNYTREEVAKHNKRDDCWLIVDNKVYDVSSFVDSHPGGDSILANAGKDNTAGFYGPQHPDTTREQIEEYYIGNLVD